MTQRKIAIGQAGGPTAVINASLAGFVASAVPDLQVFAMENGYQGLCEGRLMELDEEKIRTVIRHKDVPGACLGSGRWPVTEERFGQCVEHLRSRDIHLLAMIGGNGTMWACSKLEQTAAAAGYDLTVVGIPKTVDNDLLRTDHSPGFGSAARYVALSVRDIGGDLRSMRNFEKVRIIETMGRNVGWLAAAAGLLKLREEDPPHLIYLPERPFETDAFLQDVSGVVERYGHAVVAVSEGIRDKNGDVLAELKLQQGQKQQVLGGAGRFLARQVREQLGLASRSELLGMNQRCSAHMVSLQDRLEAEQLGAHAARLLKSGEGGVMLTLRRESAAGEPYAFGIGTAPLSEVSAGERRLPEEFLAPSPNSAAVPSTAFRDWLMPLIGEPIADYPPALF